MPHILKNKNLEIYIDLPLENYNFSRFDWTGKITTVKFQNIELSSNEISNGKNEHHFGKGFYNEFGIDTALGFDEANISNWFHKIGVGLLKKDNNQYIFNKSYEIKPANFNVTIESNKILISCKSDIINGYSYFLRKEIELNDNSFSIKYFLQNTGQKEINTNEYVHNFTSIDKDLIGSNYVLKFPFQLKTELFKENVNPEQKVEIDRNEIKFNGTPKDEFFFSYLNGNNNVNAEWEITNIKSNIRIIETGNFETNKVNLWGSKHVISPELFYTINIKPGESTEWSRNYKIYKAN
jgi:hypothetical protein